MKIAYIGQKGIPATYGGVERHVEELATRLAQRGHEVTVYCRRYYIKNCQLTIGNWQLPGRYKGVRLIYTPHIKTKHLDAITHTFTSTIHALGQPYDVIHYQGIGPSLLCFIPRIFKPKTKIVCTYHCKDYLHQKWGAFARTCLYLGELTSVYVPQATITVSKVLQEYLEKRYDRKVEYIPSGVPSFRSKKAVEIQKWGLTRDNYILSVGRLIRVKGIHILLDAYMKVRTDKRLVIVGEGAFTDNYVKALKIAAKGSPNIIFTGYQYGATLAQLFSNAYLFVHPSFSEGLSIVALEAMSYGKGVLVSDIPANLEAVGNAGFSFQTGDIKDLAKKLQDLIDHPQKVKERGEKARLRVIEKYNWDKIAARTHEFYKGLFESYPKGSPLPYKLKIYNWDQVAETTEDFYLSLL